MSGLDKATSQYAENKDDKVKSKASSEAKEMTDKEKEKKLDTFTFKSHCAMICILLALLREIDSVHRSLIIYVLKAKLEQSTFDSQSPFLTVVPLSTRRIVWLSDLILASVENVLHKKARDDMEYEVRRLLAQHSTQQAMENRM